MTTSGGSSASRRADRAGRLLLPACAGLLLLCVPLGLAAQYAAERRLFVVIALAQGALYAAAAALVLRGKGEGRLLLILSIAAALRLGTLAAPVFLSTDINRYVWDGRVEAVGINPYRYIPTDRHLRFLRDKEIFPHINRNNYAPTIYPPAAEMLFFLVGRFGGGVMAMKLMMLAVEAVGIWAMLRVLSLAGRPPEAILLYAWHPLPVWQIAGSGHVDAAAVAFLALALWASLAGKRGAGGAALAAATLTKFFPAVIGPALWRPPDWRLPAAFVAMILLLYLPYLDAHARVLGFLPGYVVEEHLASGSGIWLLDLVRALLPLPTLAYAAGAALVMAGLSIAALRRPEGPQASLAWAAILFAAALFIVSPHYPWYFVPLVALLAVAPPGLLWWPALWPTLAAPLLDWHPVTGIVPGWVGNTIYGGSVLLSAWRLMDRRRGRAA
jgi:alpha-1,6-mannosyltransferase